MPDLVEGLTRSNLITVTPVLSVAALYVAGDYVGTSSVAMTFAAAHVCQVGQAISALLCWSMRRLSPSLASCGCSAVRSLPLLIAQPGRSPTRWHCAV